ncbi:unnamed protein product [Vitrella brassicaformis CCMP3155]|uniref:Uncharacterized protein n=1 Tax=Vitrella brassicaformis (strain CCMP3155) TaxID=1169540 RepID=A0A0G4EJT8_VITBC|nr:unnamed protein product [Vitrella brassicaformis CCMP3155]|mmetsp:Transcript_49151/g.123196  ORF Transcript_49151/g.123196 Transcript_49151/m.123196 type:complete len:164 (-) Transcript_49151:65-556(-)|eukprot:CEL97695.1 unnamed protein product [Vitrella brassicaformis CCMP3155]
MNFTKLSTKVSTSFLTDPYSTLLHYKRAYKLLVQLKRLRGSALVLGSKHQFHIDWKSHFRGLEVEGGSGRVDETVLANAPLHHHLLICLDMPLYAPFLKNTHLPVLGVVTAKELHDHPEILDVLDYILPAASSRADAAFARLLSSTQSSQHETTDTQRPDSDL